MGQAEQEGDPLVASRRADGTDMALSDIGRMRIRRILEEPVRDDIPTVFRRLNDRMRVRSIEEFEGSRNPFTQEELAWFRRPIR